MLEEKKRKMRVEAWKSERIRNKHYCIVKKGEVAKKSVIYLPWILCLCVCVCVTICCGTLCYSFSFSIQTDQGDEPEGLKREG